MSADEILEVMGRYHREVLLPDMLRLEQRLGDRIDAVDAKVDSFRRETLAHFDAIYKRLEPIESEYHLLVAAVRRLEERVGSLERRIDALESRVGELERRIAALEVRVGDLDETLREHLVELKRRLAALETEN